jgi:hypothetical protein
MHRRLAILLCLCSTIASAQQLAHPGWRGNNITPEAWWRHTTPVRLPADATFAQVAAALDPISAVPADSLILPDLAPPDPSPQPFAERFGTEEQLDTLLREASARRMHVLLQAPLARLAAHPGEVRFWMNRGIAGFDLGTVTAADTGSLQTLRSTLDHFPGQRILLARQQGDIASNNKAGTRGGFPLFFRITSGEATQGASALQFVEAANKPEPASAEQNTAQLHSFLPLLLAPGQPIFDSRIIFTDAGRAALQQILQVRNAHPGLLSAQATVLQSGDLHAWLLKSTRSGQRSLVVLENTGTAPATTHLQAPLRAANARGTFLRATLRTDGGMGAIHLEGSALPAGAIVIAELQ